jgi:cytochrome c-type biogenesis protein CcmE
LKSKILQEIEILGINLGTDTNGTGNNNLEAGGLIQPSDADSVRRLLKEQKVRYEVCDNSFSLAASF